MLEQTTNVQIVRLQQANDRINLENKELEDEIKAYKKQERGRSIPAMAR